MRQMVLALVLLSILPAFAQEPAPTAPTVPPRDASGRVTYQEVAQAPGVSGADLYTRAKAWLKAKGSPQLMYFTDNPATGEVSVRDAFPIPSGGKKPGTVHFLLTIEALDGRYRYTFTGFTVAGLDKPQEAALEDSLTDAGPKPGSEKMIEDLHARVWALIASLKAGMAPA